MDNQQLASEYSDDEYSMTQQEPVYEYPDDDTKTILKILMIMNQMHLH